MIWTLEGLNDSGMVYNPTVPKGSRGIAGLERRVDYTTQSQIAGRGFQKYVLLRACCGWNTSDKYTRTASPDTKHNTQ